MISICADDFIIIIGSWVIVLEWSTVAKECLGLAKFDMLLIFCHACYVVEK